MAAGAVESNITSNNSKQGAMFDGVDDYVQVPHNANQLGANLSNGFTLSARINAKSVGEVGGKVIDKSNGGASGEDGFTLNMSSSAARVSFFLNGAGLNGASTLVIGNWYHVLVTVTAAGAAHIYYDGVSASGVTGTNAVTDITTTNAPRIGGRSGATDRSYDGTISDAKMWNKVLDADEIALDCTGGKAATSNLIINVPLKNYDGVTNSGSYITIVDDAIAAAIKADRTTANDKYIGVGLKGQFVSVVVEEAP